MQRVRQALRLEGEMTATIRITLIFAAVLGLFSASTAVAQQGKGTQGYLTDQRNGIVKDPFNLCWRTGYWTPALANCDCDVDLIPRDVCFPPPPKPAAAPPPPPPAPPPPVAKPPAPKTLAVSSTGLFAFDKSVLTPEARAQLDKEVVARLGEFSSIKLIHVEGHTDRIGTQEYNQKLSERRADAVKTYLVSKGVDGTKIETIGMGKTLQVKSCPDPSPKGEIRTFKQLIECLAPNRRAVVTVSGTGR
jgi:OmpA-OmpF porin, OOP family